MIDTSSMSARDAQEAACILEQALKVREGITAEIEHHIDAIRRGEKTGFGPLQNLKIECLARLAVMAEFHHIGVETMLKLEPKVAITWAIDEATIVRICKELARIDCDNPINGPQGDS